MIITLYGAEQLLFEEDAKKTPHGITIVDTLFFGETSSNNLRSLIVVDSLIFQEFPILNKSISLSNQDVLTFIENSSPRTTLLSFNESFVFSENVEILVGVLTGQDVLVFLESRTIQKIKTIREQLTFRESSVLQKKQTFVVSENLTFNEGSSIYKPSKTFIADGSSASVSNNPISFTWNNTTLSYRHYDFGNTETISYSRINRETLGGDIIVAPSTNNKVITLGFTLLLLKQQEADQLQQFLNDSVGELIDFVDHEGNAWEGVVSTPNAPKTQIGRYKHSISLEFQGSKQ